MASWTDMPGLARAIGGAITRAVDAARTVDPQAYQDAAAEVTALPADQTGVVLGGVVRALLEDQHPDGLDRDDISLVLSRCYQGAVAWLPVESVQVHPLLAVLASALGVHEPGVTYAEIAGPPADEPLAVRPPTAAEYAWHAPLLVADLIAATGRPLGRYLDAVFTDIARAETMEFP
jgi:hypothetical protein